MGYGFIRADTIISTLRGPVFRAVQRLQRAFREKRYMQRYEKSVTCKDNFIDCVVAWDLEVEEESEAEDNHGSDVDDSRPVPPWRPEVQRKLVVCRHWLNCVASSMPLRKPGVDSTRRRCARHRSSFARCRRRGSTTAVSTGSRGSWIQARRRVTRALRFLPTNPTGSSVQDSKKTTAMVALLSEDILLP